MYCHRTLTYSVSGKEHYTTGPVPIKILQRKFYAFWLATQNVQPIRMLKKLPSLKSTLKFHYRAGDLTPVWLVSIQDNRFLPILFILPYRNYRIYSGQTEDQLHGDPSSPIVSVLLYSVWPDLAKISHFCNILELFGVFRRLIKYWVKLWTYLANV